MPERKKDPLRKTSPSGRRIEPVEGSEFVSTKLKEANIIPEQARHFTLDDTWESDMNFAVLRAPKAKSTGADKLFTEEL